MMSGKQNNQSVIHGTPDLVLQIKGYWDLDYYHYLCKKLKRLQNMNRVEKLLISQTNYWKGEGLLTLRRERIA